MLRRFQLETTRKEGFYQITNYVRAAAVQSQLQNGAALVFCPHTTAGIILNENTDPAVAEDLVLGLDQAFPANPGFAHLEGNSSAHLKALAAGASVQVIVEKSQLILGPWQGIFFAEFDGPKTRTYYVKILGL
ncbi:MAG: secondary thiamine-phosphate synthase enzyme YjbQ [Deltaproteobacteria bacterium]|jgi:secondary thiamine-phosphate synthase enzyme|nr:secondary thiamine-phosphate synthase enzyme YjbQ [Deltaproteobacteria bacterium]